MSFYKVGDKFGVNQANLMKKIGYGDTSTPGVDEVRIFKTGEKYSLKVWNGTEWKEVSGESLKADGSVISLARQVFQSDIQDFQAGAGNRGSLEIKATDTDTPALMSFHRPTHFGINLGLDTDNQLKIGGWSVDGKYKIWSEYNHGSGSGLDADKLDGIEGREYLTGRDVTHAALTNHIQSGQDICDSGYAAWISRPYVFSKPFTMIPRVFLQHNIINGVVPVVKDITTTGFNCHIYRQSNDATRIDWLAIGVDR